MISRVAKQPIKIPAGVDVQITTNRISVKGKLGELKESFPDVIKIAKNDGQLQLSTVGGEQGTVAVAGTIRALVQNMVNGVSVGFIKKLVLVGVGYRAKV
ncbi:MAG: 50S ribosomal protein L6, partial [uncultured bacterium]